MTTGKCSETKSGAGSLVLVTCTRKPNVTSSIPPAVKSKVPCSIPPASYVQKRALCGNSTTYNVWVSVKQVEVVKRNYIICSLINNLQFTIHSKFLRITLFTLKIKILQNKKETLNWYFSSVKIDQEKDFTRTQSKLDSVLILKRWLQWIAAKPAPWLN